MQIDPATGRIVFHEFGCTLGPALTRTRFLRLSVAASSRAGAPHERWFRYQLPVVPQRDTDLYIVLHFDRERLASLDLCHVAARFGNSPAEWTPEREAARRAFHEQWLAAGMGLPCGPYRWGEVRSHHDAQDGASLITITYHVPNAWQAAGRAAGRWWGAAAGGRS